MPRAKLTTAERRLLDIRVMNYAQDLSYRVDRYNACWDANDNLCVTISVCKRREREVMKAAEKLAEVYSERPSDALLRVYFGEKEVLKRDRLLSASGTVIPLKRDGRPAR